ncbi:metal dependent phosphohydrolase [Vibrio sinaloensis DSM 21326]|uniref:Metal dependent phosphohydrolase n=2 Tax=Photobacterium sp. (strain ATCC 43367) TaxID=379097 RepID=E8M3F3_PHOS4|nr:metal dependent phosphohydrolase [Vibrio sinaloensis DSM 21326]
MDLSVPLEREYLTKHDFYRDLIDTLVEEANSQVGYLHFFDAATNEIALNVWSTKALEHCHSSHETHYPLSAAGIWADSIRTNKPVIHNDYPMAHHAPESLPEGHISLHHHFSVPITFNGKVVAIVGIGNGDTGYNEAEVECFWSRLNQLWPQVEAKASQITHSNSGHRKVFESRSPYSILTGMLGAISRALEIRDEYTSSHQRNVAHLCELIADQMHLSEHDKQGLIVGALVHDIGKIAIPSQLLNKTGQLMPVEYDLLKSHSEIGSSIFKDVDFPWPIIDIVEQHHERLDGSGYPKGLKGNQILMEARIVAVADTFDAMASDRPYRKALGARAAINTLKRGRNTLYDPYVVDAFLLCYTQDKTLGGCYTPGGA